MLVAIVSGFVTVSCSTSATTSQVRGTSTSTQPPTPTPTLTTLRADSGWTTALDLGYVSDGVTTSGGTFQATNVYTILVTCEGVGKVVVDYEPQGTATFVCSSSPQSFGNQIGSQDRPPARDTIHVNVTADSGVVWRALIEVKQ